ncbi:hypothetical protein ABFS83_06G126700 [Erythranthe nasuta]
MASCGSADGVMKNRKLKINTILAQVQQLTDETETETEKWKSRVNKLVRGVKKLQTEETKLVTKTSELRSSKKGIVRLFMFGRAMAKLLYDRDSNSTSTKDDDDIDPILVHDLNVYAQLSLNAYNKKHSSKYVLVEVARAFRSLPITHVHSLYLMFTAKLDDDDDDAKTFQTEMRFGWEYISVVFVDTVDPRIIISHTAI